MFVKKACSDVEVFSYVSSDQESKRSSNNCTKNCGFLPKKVNFNFLYFASKNMMTSQMILNRVMIDQEIQRENSKSNH